MSAEREPTGGGRALAAYVGVFLLLCWRWLSVATHAIPTGALLVSSGDARLITWALAWVTHALTTAPRHLFDANINYPAPAQLTGSEHFGTSQLLFAPVFLATGNALLGANLVAWASYPLSAFAMERLLRAFAFQPLVAWVGGLAYALGPLRVPGNLQVIQYFGFCLPLVSLALLRLRERPAVRAAAVLTAVTVLGVFSSYYMAVMMAVAAALWTVAEVLDRRPARVRFLLLVAGAAALTFLLLLMASRPYLERTEATAGGDDLLSGMMQLYRAYRDVPGVSSVVAFATDQARVLGPGFMTDPSFVARLSLAMLRLVPSWLGMTPLALGLVGLLALRAATPGVLHAARRGLVLALVATVLMLGPIQFLFARPVALPFAALAISPARFFRFPFRFIVLLGFGLALLGAAALEAAWQVSGRRVGLVLCAAVGLVVVVERGTVLVGEVEEVAGQTAPVYAAVAESARADGPGALLELPIRDARGATFEWDAMVGSTRHWLPLVTGMTGYRPAHRALVDAAVARLPADDALDDLVDMTHVRWLLLRPVGDWSEGWRREGMLHLHGVALVVERDGWSLLRVERTPHREEWFGAIVAGGVPDLRAVR